jgi:hypothetical protein
VECRNAYPVGTDFFVLLSAWPRVRHRRRRDPAKFLHIDMDHVPWCGVFVADRFGFADGQPVFTSM